MVLEFYTPKREDARAITDMIFEGYSDDIVSKRMAPLPASEESKVSTTEAMLHGWGKNANEYRIMAKDADTGDLISFIHWIVVLERTDEDWKVFEEIDCPPDYDKEYFSSVMKLAFEERVKNMGTQPYVFFQTLVTPPQFRKRGAGTMLTKALVDFAAKLNLPVYLAGTPTGTLLYRKFGFKEISTFELDISKVSTERRINTCMLLPAPHPDQPARIPPQVPVDDIVIKPVITMEDHIAWQTISDRAFADREVFALAFGRDHFSPSERAKKEMKTIEESPLSSFRHYQAIDPVTGVMLGSSKWYYVWDTSIEHHPYGRGWSPGTNIELADKHFAAAGRERSKVMAGKPHVYVCTLVVNPEAQRRGIGGKLLRHGLEEVDERGLEAWIEATPEGLDLYKRFGWEPVGSITTDLRPYGGHDFETTVWLLRKPGAKEKA